MRPFHRHFLVRPALQGSRLQRRHSGPILRRRAHSATRSGVRRGGARARVRRPSRRVVADFTSHVRHRTERLSSPPKYLFTACSVWRPSHGGRASGTQRGGEAVGGAGGRPRPLARASAAAQRTVAVPPELALDDDADVGESDRRAAVGAGDGVHCGERARGGGGVRVTVPPVGHLFAAGFTGRDAHTHAAVCAGAEQTDGGKPGYAGAQQPGVGAVAGLRRRGRGHRRRGAARLQSRAAGMASGCLPVDTGGSVAWRVGVSSALLGADWSRPVPRVRDVAAAGLARRGRGGHAAGDRPARRGGIHPVAHAAHSPAIPAGGATLRGRHQRRATRLRSGRRDQLRAVPVSRAGIGGEAVLGDAPLSKDPVLEHSYHRARWRGDPDAVGARRTGIAVAHGTLLLGSWAAIRPRPGLRALSASARCRLAGGLSAHRPGGGAHRSPPQAAAAGHGGAAEAGIAPTAHRFRAHHGGGRAVVSGRLHFVPAHRDRSIRHQRQGR
eukprot:ctg_3495.g563